MTGEQLYAQITSILLNVMQQETINMLRMRYNTNHSDMERRLEKANMEREQTVNFYKAKTLYLENRDVVDNYYKEEVREVQIILNNDFGERRHCFQQLCEVIEKELQDAIESKLLGSNNPETNSQHD